VDGHLLVTSRSGSWAGTAVPVEVDVLARAESVAFLRRLIPSIADADADTVADTVGDLPLALAQAGGVPTETGMSARPGPQAGGGPHRDPAGVHRAAAGAGRRGFRGRGSGGLSPVAGRCGHPRGGEGGGYGSGRRSTAGRVRVSGARTGSAGLVHSLDGSDPADLLPAPLRATAPFGGVAGCCGRDVFASSPVPARSCSSAWCCRRHE
jgi:hypothetical protein